MKSRSLLVGLLLPLAAVQAFAQGVSMQPERIIGGRTEAIVFVPHARRPEDDRRELARIVSSCRVAMDFAAADSIEIVDVRPPAARLATPIRGPYVVINVVPQHFSTPGCRGNSSLYTLLPTRGVRLTFDTESRREHSVAGVSLQRGTAEVPAAVQLLELRRYGPQGFDEPLQRWARVTVRLEDLAPDVRGRFAPLRLSVETELGVGRDEYEVPADVIQRAWMAALPALAEASGPGAATLQIPRPTDVALRRAHDEFVAGDLANATALATARAAMPDAPADERHWAYAVAGIGFEAMGRSDAARVAFRSALVAEPCFSLDPAAGRAMLDLVDALRDPAVNCRTTALSTVAARALVLPGFGRSTIPSQVPRRGLVPLAMVGLSLGAVAMGATARDTYDRYVAWQVTPEALQSPNSDGARALYQDAESQRAVGRALWMATAGVYVGQLAVGLWRERRLQRRLQAVGAFGAPLSTSAVTPDASRFAVFPLALPSAGGVAFRFYWLR